MPTYEYVCLDCKETMEIRATIAEKEKGLKPLCSRCGSQRMAQVFGGFTMMSARGGLGGSGCGPGARPGCCG